MEAKHTPGPLAESDALYWESTARSLRLEGRRSQNYESKQIHERDARACEEHAARIRAAIAKATQ